MDQNCPADKNLILKKRNPIKKEANFMKFHKSCSYSRIIATAYPGFSTGLEY